MKKYAVFFCSLLISLSSAASDFHCSSGEGLDIRKEEDKSYFGFYFDKRLVAYRHLETQVSGRSYILTNNYDLEIILFEKEEGSFEGAFKGRLRGKILDIPSLECLGKL
ncbi:hypothetical protein OAK75_08750 [Bacteriovoracales bacterium]|nr:hypothetical protein [Bacteriovoracales bacterium]